MPINVKISLCKITRASRLFQRNYYLPLLKPLSPKDALRRKIITGQNVLGNRIEHYIPVLKPHDEKLAERRRRPRGVPIIKKRLRRRENARYVEPFFDDDIEGHDVLKELLAGKSQGRGQSYVYEVPDKGCHLVINYAMERALKDRDIVDITMAQRSEKILVKLADGTRISVPVAAFNGTANLYRGSGWTKEIIEKEHHHGKETYSIAKLFEAKESGVEEWELEMMRMANKRKRKVKGEDAQDWKAMLAACLENMDWDKFEEETRQIVEEQEQKVEVEDIPMEVDDMDKTKNVNEKLKAAGEEVLSQLPTMLEVPQVIKNLEQGEMEEMANVSGARVQIPDSRSCFVPGQMVKTEDGEVFVPGQTIENEDGSSEYVPGVTVLLDGQPELIPGLVLGEEETQPMFLPGEAAITEEGQLRFEATEEDLPEEEEGEEEDEEEENASEPERTPSPPPYRRRSLTPSPPPTFKRQPKVIRDEDIVIKRRTFNEPQEPLIKDRPKKRAAMPDAKTKTKTKGKPKAQPREVTFRPRPPMEDPLKLLEEDRQRREEAEKKRMKERMEHKIRNEETKVMKLRMEVRKKMRELKIEKPPKYEPIKPVQKSARLEELELSIKQGTFFDDDKTKEILEKAKSQTRMLKYQHLFNVYVNEFDFRRH